MIQDAVKFIDDHKLIAFVRTSVPEDAEKIALALLEGGIRVLQVAVTIPQAFKLIETLSKKESILVGAATVLDGEVAQKAINAGARFVETPYTDKDVIYVCKNNGVSVFQGASTLTEAVEATRLGVDLVEIYPADILGGPSYIRILRGPAPFLKLVPSGGVHLDNLIDYVKMGSVAMVLGSNVIEKSLIRANQWESIRDRARQFVDRLESLKVPR